MTTTLFIFIALLLLMVVYFFVLGQKSKSGTPPGLVGDRLAPCSSKPNCICSEYIDDDRHYQAPIDITGLDGNNVHGNIKAVIQDLGGELQTDSVHYLAFTFRSAIFGYVDDVEVRIDIDKNALHIRSASRVGHSDLGANGKRVEAIKQAFQQR